MSDRGQLPPPDFVSYVENMLPLLERGARRLAGEGAPAEDLARELLSLVAVRWRRLVAADARHGSVPGTAADAYLRRLFAREAAEVGTGDVAQLQLGIEPSLPPGGDPRRSRRTTDEAAAIWERGRLVVRRRLLLVGALGGAAGLIAWCGRGGGGTPEAEPSLPTWQAAGFPVGTDLLPDTAGLAGLPEVSLGDQLPVLWEPDPEPPALSAQPVDRIWAVFAPDEDEDRLMAIGDFSAWRQLDNVPEDAGSLLQSTSLSPDGRRLVLVTGQDRVTVYDLMTGQARDWPRLPNQATPIWAGPQHLLLSTNSLLDVVTGVTEQPSAGPADVAVPQLPLADDARDRLIELLAQGTPLTAPARVRHWLLDGPEPVPAVTPLRGPLAELIGAWRGPGFGVGGAAGRLVRACEPRLRRTDVSYSVTVAAVDAEYADALRLLLVDERVSGPLTLLGWASSTVVLLQLSQQLIAWYTNTGQLVRVGVLSQQGAVAFSDLGAE